MAQGSLLASVRTRKCSRRVRLEETGPTARGPVPSQAGAHVVLWGLLSAGRRQRRSVAGRLPDAGARRLSGWTGRRQHPSQRLPPRWRCGGGCFAARRKRRMPAGYGWFALGSTREVIQLRGSLVPLLHRAPHPAAFPARGCPQTFAVLVSGALQQWRAERERSAALSWSAAGGAGLSVPLAASGAEDGRGCSSHSACLGGRRTRCIISVVSS